MNSMWTKFKESKAGIFLANPIVSLVLSCLLAIAVGYFFYNLGDKSPNLVIRESPVRSSIVKAGGVSDLSVSFRGKQVTSDLTVMQVALWNSGKGSIHHKSILEPISIDAGPNVPIYSATIRTVSRGVVGFTLITNELDNGKIIFDWNIMEHNDGASIQILYGGNQKVVFKSAGIIEEQNSIPFYVASENNGTRSVMTIIATIFSLIVICPPVFGAFINQYKFVIAARKSGTKVPISYYIVTGGIYLFAFGWMCSLVYSVYSHIYLSNLPPFGF